MRSALLLVLGAIPFAAYAHPQHDAAGFLEGLLHPWAGLDHLLAMVAVGVVALRYRDEKAQLWVLPLCFLAALGLGATAAALFSLAAAPWEIGVVASLFILGALLFVPQTLSLRLAAPLVALFGLAHGAVHGVEMSASVSAFPFIAGVLFASALLHALGIWGMRMLHLQVKRQVERLLGALLGAAGLALLV